MIIKHTKNHTFLASFKAKRGRTEADGRSWHQPRLWAFVHANNKHKVHALIVPLSRKAWSK